MTAGTKTGWFEAASSAVGHPLMVVRSSDWVALYVNEEGRKALASLEGGEPVGRSAHDFLFRDPSAERRLTEALEQGRGRTKDLMLRVGREDADPVWLRVSIEPFDDDGEPCRMVSWSDVSAVVEANAELVRSREAEKVAAQAKSEFLARMSHELRTPLNAIIGFAEMLHEQIFGPLGSEKYVEYARDIQDSGRHLLLLINDLLDMARIEVGKYELNRRMVDVAIVVEGARRLTQKAADEKQVIVAVNIPIGMPRVYGDERALRQVVHNLLSNAVKFSPAGGRVVINADANAAILTVKISDCGAGIPPTDIDRILKPFERGRDLAHADDGSAGLGLPLAKHLIEMHGGSLWLESTVGAGTVACFTMPRVPTSA
ncbi:MAG: PAS domain-containing sensor histidine kinase [Alphaproteobacteria bacterium]|nr:PAS domain-containing sensor histidine kinase [Alphaproteobacteria bacterium]